jgi:preprotein translocase subunit SecB
LNGSLVSVTRVEPSQSRFRELPPDFVPHLAQLVSAWLEGVEFRLHPGFDPNRDQAVYSLDADHEISVGEDEDSTALVTVSLTINWSPSEESQAAPEDFEPPFNLSITMGGMFEWPEPQPIERRRAWTEYNGMYLVWPYLRAEVANIVSASNLPGFTLPTLAVPRPESWAESEESAPPSKAESPAG